MRILRLSYNRLSYNRLSYNRLSYNRLSYNQLSINGADPAGGFQTWNALFSPEQFSEETLGSNRIDPDVLGPDGVGDLSSIQGSENNILDNRFISEELKEGLCMDDAFLEYFSALVELAWPSNAEFRLCCSDSAGSSANSACLEPDYVFSSAPQVEGLQPLVMAPHFLTEKFGAGQQEALTAALIAKLNVHGQPLAMDVTGIFDLDTAGTRFIAGREPGFENYLGSAWGNMFLDCLGKDNDHVLCKASKEEDSTIGRDPQFAHLPLFTCSGLSGYPTLESGKACFSEDMATNEKDGCELVAAVGPCNRVCVGGFCGVNDPPLEGRGTKNVLYVYMNDYMTDDGDSGSLALKILLPLAAALVALVAVAFALRRLKKHNAKKVERHAPQEKTSKDAESGSSVDNGTEISETIVTS